MYQLLLHYSVSLLFELLLHGQFLEIGLDFLVLLNIIGAESVD